MMHKSLSVLALLSVLSAGTTDAQSFLSDAAREQLAQQGADRRPNTLVWGALGALIGAGGGFMASQIIHHDWEKSSNSTFASHRRTFALSGAAFGAMGAVLLDRVAKPGSGPLLIRPDVASRTGAGGAITREEILKSSARNAYEAVQSLRPQWLIVRGESVGSLGRIVGGGGGGGGGGGSAPPEGGGGGAAPSPPSQSGADAMAAVSGQPRIGAFLDGVSLDDVVSLRDIPVTAVARIEFRTGSVNASGGPGHVQRAIVVISATGIEE